MTITVRKIPKCAAGSPSLRKRFLAGQEKPFPVISTVDEPNHRRAFPLQARLSTEKLAHRGPCPDNVGLLLLFPPWLTQWTILWDQYNRQRLALLLLLLRFLTARQFELRPDSALG